MTNHGGSWLESRYSGNGSNEFKANLSYVVSYRSARATQQKIKVKQASKKTSYVEYRLGLLYLCPLE